MGLEKTMRELASATRKLDDRVRELRVTVVEDRPLKGDASLVDKLEYAVEDLIGWLREMLEAAKAAQRAVGHPLDVDGARRALVTCQERLRRIEQVFTKTVSYEQLADLTTFGAERRGEWPSWVTSVKHGLEHCRQPLEDVRRGMADCWEEIAERVGMTSVTVQTNIGQRADPATEDFVERAEGS